ncbi:hypothetical protein HDV05_003216, partial [Chytridiales sp. JEL 0842]
ALSDEPLPIRTQRWLVLYGLIPRILKEVIVGAEDASDLVKIANKILDSWSTGEQKLGPLVLLKLYTMSKSGQPTLLTVETAVATVKHYMDTLTQEIDSNGFHATHCAKFSELFEALGYTSIWIHHLIESKTASESDSINILKLLEAKAAAFKSLVKLAKKSIEGVAFLVPETEKYPSFKGAKDVMNSLAKEVKESWVVYLDSLKL